MNENVFREFLKKSGRQPNVIEKYVIFVRDFEAYLKVLIGYIAECEEKTKKSTRTMLYAFMQYFKATENTELYKTALELRETRKTKKTPFLLKKIMGIETEYITQLNEIRIRNVHDMLTAGKTPKQRRKLAEKTKIPYEVILELVKISDLTRVGYDHFCPTRYESSYSVTSLSLNLKRPHSYTFFNPR